MKKCNRCFIEKSLDSFNIARSCTDGHRNYCKKCQVKKQREWLSKNREHHNQKSKLWVINNKEKRREINKKYTERTKEIWSKYHSLWRKENKDKVNFSTFMRRKRIKQATPRWVDRDAMYDIYIEAQYTQLTIDHIIPLRHPLVCGLNVPDNLQLLTLSENSSKSNKYEIV